MICTKWIKHILQMRSGRVSAPHLTRMFTYYWCINRVEIITTFFEPTSLP